MKFVCHKENFCNFVFGEHSDYCLYYFVIEHYKGTTIFSNHQIYRQLYFVELTLTKDFTQTITEPQHKCLVTGNPRRLWHLERRLKRKFEATLSVCRSESFLLEILPKGIDKAEALKNLLDRVGGRTDELLCCGDGYNDLGMMRLAGISCATQNAKKPVKQAATFVTKSNDRDGVAHAVECKLYQ